ncbi:uncharacterized protein HD556DRAFT_1448526 [Suillus plorans]|uniref:Uncharacterized protein n=1 Tax=Suillus plorans TaxID=116603 RepID=A0A9P7AEA9_9AGAM|nr:uncharacterized protein HD556DRAFT_1448526 [Suillus plorans]KAG1787679.1 hypothetical protein HD556DRAFT_1448526 [Suillus plorans]
MRGMSLYSGPTSPPSSAGISPFITASAGMTLQTSPLPSRPFSQHSQVPSASSILSTDGCYAEFIPQLSLHLSPTWQGQVPYQSTPESFQSQASRPPHPQHARALTTAAKPVHSSRGLGKNIAAGVLGLLGGVVLTETAGDDNIVDDITEIMDDMSIGNSADDQSDPDMGTNNNQGSGFDSTDVQGDQTSPGDASNVTDYQGDQTFTKDFFDTTTNIQVDQTFSGVSFDVQYYQGDQTVTEDFFDPTVNIQVDQTFDGVSFDAPYYQGDLIVTEDIFDPTANIQVDQTFDEVSFDAQYYQGDQTFAEDFFDSMANIQVDQKFDGVSFDAPYYQGDQLFTGDPSGQTWVVSDQTIGNGVDPNQSQGLHHTSPQSSHTSHTQNPHMNHGAHPSFVTATHTTHLQGPPIPAHNAVNHGHGTAPHHAHSPQSQVGSSVHPAQYHAQGNSQQNHTGQQNHTSQHKHTGHHHSHHSHGLNKTMELVKDTLTTGSALAVLVGNGNG